MKNVTMLLLTTLSRHKSSSYSNTETLSGTPFSDCSWTEIYATSGKVCRTRRTFAAKNDHLYILYCCLCAIAYFAEICYVTTEAPKRTAASQPWRRRLSSAQQFRFIPFKNKKRCRFLGVSLFLVHTHSLTLLLLSCWASFCLKSIAGVATERR